MVHLPFSNQAYIPTATCQRAVFNVPPAFVTALRWIGKRNAAVDPRKVPPPRLNVK
jgi:hypothetical protein